MLCSIIEGTIKETVYSGNAESGEQSNFDVNIYFIVRGWWPVFEGTNMWDFEGKADFQEYVYGCGSHVETCTEVRFLT